MCGLYLPSDKEVARLQAQVDGLSPWEDPKVVQDPETGLQARASIYISVPSDTQVTQPREVLVFDFR